MDYALTSPWSQRDGLLLSFLLVSGCRPPQVPVLEKDVSVIQYDTALEEQLKKWPSRCGSAWDGMERYVDSLSEPVAVSEWSADHCKWDFFVATNRGCFESTATDPLADEQSLESSAIRDVAKSSCLATTSACA